MRSRSAKSEELTSLIHELGDEELDVLLLISRRLKMGQRAYGRLSLKTDARNWRNEARAEWADAAVYAACAMLKLSRA